MTIYELLDSPNSQDNENSEMNIQPSTLNPGFLKNIYYLKILLRN